MSGSGTFVFPDGQVYEGEFVDIDGKRVRQGKVLTAVAPSLPNPLSAPQTQAFELRPGTAEREYLEQRFSES